MPSAHLSQTCPIIVEKINPAGLSDDVAVWNGRFIIEKYARGSRSRPMLGLGRA